MAKPVEPARHSVVLDCKAVSQCENLEGWAKTRQPFSVVSEPNFNQIWGAYGGVSVD